MPYVFLNLKPVAEEARDAITKFLPQILADELSVTGRDVHDGGLTEDEIMIWPLPSAQTLNGKHVEIVVFAHPFPERLEDIEKRKEEIIRRLKNLFEIERHSLSFAVCIIMAPMAYGEGRAGS